MNSAHPRGSEWKTLDTDGDGHHDRVEVETKYILEVDDPPLAVTSDPKRSDWIILRVKSFASDPGTIPKHSSLCIPNAAPSAVTDILVPSHPRRLPLKIAEGVITKRGTDQTLMYAMFDAWAGSSGSPVVSRSDPTALLGVVQGAAQNAQRDARVCVVYGLDSCEPQPVTPTSHFYTKALKHEGVQTCPLTSTN